MAKGAMQWQTLIVIILTLLAGVVMLLFIGQSGKISSEVGDKEACLSSVRNQALTSRITPASSVDLRCTTHYETTAVAKPEDQKALLAKEMASCWEQYGEGKIRLFQDETGSYCVVCSRLAFTKPARLDHFTQFLFDTQVPAKGKTYYGYLFNTEGTSQVLQDYRASGIADQDTIDTARPQAVIYVATKNVDKWWGYITGGAIGVGAAVAVFFSGGTLLPVLIAGGAAGGASGFIVTPYMTDREYRAGIILWPYDDIKQLKCSLLEGKAGPLTFT